MKIIGLTGGVGSGKTTVAKEFEALGVPVFISDIEAKKLMSKSETIKHELIQLFGNDVYKGKKLNKALVAKCIFEDKIYLQKMNAIIHPRVAKHFKKWVLKQDAPYIIKETAILFESGGDKLCDYVITVVAPEKIRLERVLSRDKTTKEKVEAIMKNQWNDEDRVKQSNFIIYNIKLEDIKSQVLDIHNKILDEL